MLRAMRGRASYSGERSIGSPDPGAIAVAVMLEQIAGDWPDIWPDDGSGRREE
jgi:dihydroxyacetone kinase